jgi:hypothetical protein
MPNRHVIVGWPEGGPSDRYTNNEGIADTKINRDQYCRYVEVNGVQVLGESRLKDGVNTVYVDN